MWQGSCHEVLDRRASNRKEWLSKETWSRITQIKCLKEEINRSSAEQARKRDLKSTYWQLSRDVRKNAIKDKKEFFFPLATEAKNAAWQQNMKRSYQITRTMSGKRSKLKTAVKNKEGRIVFTESGLFFFLTWCQRGRYTIFLLIVINLLFQILWESTSFLLWCQMQFPENNT